MVLSQHEAIERQEEEGHFPHCYGYYYYQLKWMDEWQFPQVHESNQNRCSRRMVILLPMLVVVDVHSLNSRMRMDSE